MPPQNVLKFREKFQGKLYTQDFTAFLYVNFKNFKKK